MPIQSTRHSKKNKKSSKQKKHHEALTTEQVREIFGIVFYTLALLFILSLTKNVGMAGVYVSEALNYVFGIGAFIAPLLLAVLATYLFFVKDVKFHYFRILGIVICVISILSLIHIGAPLNNSYNLIPKFGGIIGFVFSSMMRIAFGDYFSYFSFTALLIVSVQLMLSLSFAEIYRKLMYPITEVKIRPDEDVEDVRPSALSDTLSLDIIKPKRIDEPLPVKMAGELDGKVVMHTSKPKTTGIKISNFVESDDDWQFPSLDLLSSEVSDVYPDDKLLKDQADTIKEKLAQFGIIVEVVSARVGPAVTQFTLKPNEGIKVAKIAASKNDLALALSAKSVRIEAPIPGQPYVGIEIPNKDRSTVYMKEILTSDKFIGVKNSKLRICLGKDVAGNCVVEDLEKMPHLLIAGATNSGKSVCVNTLLISLLYQNSPKELKFIMVDPKMVELESYNGIPHLLTPVIMDGDKALSALKWTVAEMMRRYTECREKGYRNIKEFNEQEEKKMPRIVIVIDELADLMMREFKKETENNICRIAQMARAVGIHLIIATQRPSVDVITGLIKANIPTRIAFSVTSSVDSRTIIDSIGAEDLLGMGDMLFLNPSAEKPNRIQGIYVSSKEIQAVTNHIKLTKEPENDEDLVMNESSSSSGVIDFDAISQASAEDDKIMEAIEAIKQTGKASATLLQRMLSVGYARAAKLLDILESKGMIGPADGAKPRKVFHDKFPE